MEPNQLPIPPSSFVPWYVLALVVATVAGVGWRRLQRRPAPPQGPGAVPLGGLLASTLDERDPYLIALLAGGLPRVVQSAVVRLVLAGVLRPAGDRWEVAAPPPRTGPAQGRELEAALVAAAGAGVPGDRLVTDAGVVAAGEGLQRRAVEAGWLPSARSRVRSRMAGVPLFVLAALGFAGWLWVAFGGPSPDGEPVPGPFGEPGPGLQLDPLATGDVAATMALMLLCWGAVLVGGILARPLPPSPRLRQELRRLTERQRGAKASWVSADVGGAEALGVALLGPAYPGWSLLDPPAQRLAWMAPGPVRRVAGTASGGSRRSPIGTDSVLFPGVAALDGGAGAHDPGGHHGHHGGHHGHHGGWDGGFGGGGFDGSGGFGGGFDGGGSDGGGGFGGGGCDSGGGASC